MARSRTTQVRSERHQELPQLWRSAPRRWGHVAHSMCSYLAMFPPAIPRVFIEWLTSEGDTVWDPFSGRGTTALEACLAGRVGVGSDANPLAALLTGAKVDPPSPGDVAKRLEGLGKRDRTPPAETVPDDIRMLFDPTTLRDLLWLRSELRPANRVDRYLLALLVGGLHANADSQGTPRGLTVAMPNTFSMSPGYVRGYIKAHALLPPRKDVLAFLRARCNSFPPPSLQVRGRAWQASVLDGPSAALTTEPARLAFMSPPYLHVIMYGKYNWIRLWLLGHERRDVDATLFASGSLTRYLEFMSGAITSAREGLRDDGFVCLVIGDVRRGEKTTNLAEAVAQTCFAGSDLRVTSIVEDALPVRHKVSRIWAGGKGRATKTDRIVIAKAPKARFPRVPSLSSAGWRYQACP